MLCNVFICFQCNVVMDGEKMTETQKIGDVSIVITREVVGGELVSVSKMGFWVFC